MKESCFTWVSPYGADDSRGGWKSMQFHLLRALERKWGPAQRIAPVDAPENLAAKWLSRLLKKVGIPRSYAYYSEQRLAAYARVVETQMPADRNPVVFFGPLPFVKCRPQRPYYMYTDGAFFIHYWEYNQDHSHARSEISRICRAEAEFMSGADGVWCSSQWAADRITREYNLQPGQARFVGTGPGKVPLPLEPVRHGNYLVMIAADFERKGGRMAVKAVQHARADGVDVGIKVIGDQPPQDLLTLPYLEWCGWLDLTKAGDAQRFAQVMSNAGAQILLSRADLTPLAIPEAAGYSKATIATAVGGIPEMIQDGVTGWLLPPEATVEQAGDCIAPLFRNPDLLRTAGAAAKRECERTWNWDRVAERGPQLREKTRAVKPELLAQE